MSASPRILQAAIEVVAARGLEGTSVRSVAMSAGVSIGAVQHHFKTKEELLAAAMQAVGDDFERHLSERLAAAASPISALREVLYALACTDDDASPAAVWIAFAARAAVDPQIRQVHSSQWAQVEALVRQLVLAVQPGDRDVDLVAGGLLAMVDGIAVARVAENGRMSAERARALVEAACARL
ncbi:MAG: TetR/AcrR family transcriptional regulator [Beutenbergiaceae bacterium]